MAHYPLPHSLMITRYNPRTRRQFLLIEETTPQFPWTWSIYQESQENIDSKRDFSFRPDERLLCCVSWGTHQRLNWDESLQDFKDTGLLIRSSFRACPFRFRVALPIQLKPEQRTLALGGWIHEDFFKVVGKKIEVSTAAPEITHHLRQTHPLTSYEQHEQGGVKIMADLWKPTGTTQQKAHLEAIFAPNGLITSSEIRERCLGSELSRENREYGLQLIELSLNVDFAYAISGKYQDWCAWCGQPEPPLECERCGSAAYCGEDCQNMHWKQGNHRMDCDVLASSISEHSKEAHI